MNCYKIPEINYNYNERMDQPSRIPYIPINIPEPFPYAFDRTKNVTSHEVDLNNSIPSRQRRELDNGGLDAIDNIRGDYMKPINFHRPVTPKILEVEKVVPSFHVTYWMFYPYSQVNYNFPLHSGDIFIHYFTG